MNFIIGCDRTSERASGTHSTHERRIQSCNELLVAWKHKGLYYFELNNLWDILLWMQQYLDFHFFLIQCNN